MKKFAILVALCLVFAIAAPALATDVSFSGTYRVRAILDYNRGIYENAGTALSNNQNDWLDHRLRMQTEFKVSDNLKLVTRLDGWDTAMWGTGAEFINWDKIYMEIISPIGFWRIGRNNAGNWGTDFAGDGGGDEDNITYVLPIGKLYLGAKFAKVTENDGSSLASSNSDYDKYVVSATYRGEGFEAGLLYGIYKDDSNASSALAFPLGVTSPSATWLNLISPYFKATFGDFYLEGEYIYGWGDMDFDNPATQDVDVETHALWIKGAYTMGPATVFGAYAYAMGDSDDLQTALGSPLYNEKEFNAILPVTADGDFTPLLILWDSNNQMNLGANQFGWDYLGGGGINAYFGASCFVVGGTYQVTENVGLGLTVGYAEADDVPSAWDDDYGWEYDVSLTWKIMDNLSFTSIFAYLDAGDIYKGSSLGAAGAFLAGDFAGGLMTPAATTDIENPMMWYNSLTLSF